MWTRLFTLFIRLDDLSICWSLGCLKVGYPLIMHQEKLIMFLVIMLWMLMLKIWLGLKSLLLSSRHRSWRWLYCLLFILWFEAHQVKRYIILLYLRKSMHGFAFPPSCFWDALYLHYGCLLPWLPIQCVVACIARGFLSTMFWIVQLVVILLFGIMSCVDKVSV